MTLLVNPIPIEGAQELPNSLKNNWQVPVFMDNGESGFIHLNLMPKTRRCWLLDYEKKQELGQHWQRLFKDKKHRHLVGCNTATAPWLPNLSVPTGPQHNRRTKSLPSAAGLPSQQAGLMQL